MRQSFSLRGCLEEGNRHEVGVGEWWDGSTDALLIFLKIDMKEIGMNDAFPPTIHTGSIGMCVLTKRKMGLYGDKLRLPRQKKRKKILSGRVGRWRDASRTDDTLCRVKGVPQL